MAPNPILTFSLTADQWTAAKAAVQQQAGVVLTGNVGAASKDGVTISYGYDPSSQRLALTVTKRAFFDPSVDTIDAKLTAAVQAILQQK